MFYSIVDGDNSFSKYKNTKQKLKAVLLSPAALMVFKLQCDLFSIANIEAKQNEEDVNHEILKLLKNPNPFQTQKQFLWDFMFWNMLGVSYLYSSSKVVDGKTKSYWLNPTCIEFPNKLLNKLDKHYFSEKEINKLKEEHIIYQYKNGSKVKIKLKEIHSFADLSNGMGNWYGGQSSLDALYKVIANSEAALDAKNVNLEFAGKYLIGGDATSDNQYEQPLNKGEKTSLENIATSNKKITAVKSQINISRFVDNIANLKLDESFYSDYFAIGKMYSIPKDVLEAFLVNGATYENQEKSRGSHVAYTLIPKGDDLGNGLEQHFSLDVNISLSWDHLPFMQVFEKDKADVNKIKAETIKTLMDAGVTPDSINELLGIEINIDERYKKNETVA